MSTSQEKSQEKNRPVRIGVYTDLSAAEQAFQSLLDAGFTHGELSVLCSNQLQRRHFPESVTEGDDPESLKAAASGSAIGAVLGGVGAAVGLASVAGIPVVVAGALASALTGGVVGGLTGVMSERGFEGAEADYFEQAVADGKILIAVEPTDAEPARLQKADELLQAAGAEPIALRES